MHLITFSLITLVLIAVSCIVIIIYRGYKFNNIDKISFREALDLTSLPIITFTISNRKLNFLLDTGSTASHINRILIEKSVIEYSPINTVMKVTGMEGTTRTTNVVKLCLTLNNQYFENEFMVNDLSAAFSAIKKENGVTLHGIVGSDFFSKYKYVIDFKDYVAYSKK